MSRGLSLLVLLILQLLALSLKLLNLLDRVLDELPLEINATFNKFNLGHLFPLRYLCKASILSDISRLNGP